MTLVNLEDHNFIEYHLNADLYGNGDMVKRKDVKKATSFIVHRSY